MLARKSWGEHTPNLHYMPSEWQLSSPLWHSIHFCCRWWAPEHWCLSGQLSGTGRPQSVSGEGDQLDCQTGGQRSARFYSAVERHGSAMLTHSPIVSWKLCPCIIIMMLQAYTHWISQTCTAACQKFNPMHKLRNFIANDFIVDANYENFHWHIISLEGY